MIYCDNAATSHPKPQCVYDSASDFLQNVGASPGRSTHRLAVEASRIVFDTREKLAELFNIADSSRIAFTANATESLNLAMFGLLKPGDIVVTTSMEHNSVMRPLRRLSESSGINVRMVQCNRQGEVPLDEFESACKEGARMAVVNHGSNIIGTLAPLEDIGKIAKKYGALLLVDAAQSAGASPIDVEAMKIDLLAFSGHKSLYGLQGTGGLYIADSVEPVPLKFGGTGSNSESDIQPTMFPDRYESGTANGPGIAALGAGAGFILEKGTDTIHRREQAIVMQLLDGLEGLRGVVVHGPKRPADTLPTLSLTFDGADNALVAQRLNDDYGICTRVGLHCAPNAHRTIGTFPHGTLRISFGLFNTEKEVEQIVDALKRICA
jgi:cysteine desulfurase family protein